MGKNIIFIIIIIGAAILLLSISIPLYLTLNKKKLPETYDCYLLSIFWTPSSCETKYKDNAECYQKIKDLGIEKYFTIHGLWPSTLEGIIPPPCNQGYENKTIQPDFDSNPEYNDKMSHYWPGLYNGDKSLWKHEYNKHGYCYMKRNYLNFIDDYQIYFNKTIEMFEEGYRYLMENIYPDSRGLRNVSKAKFKKMLKNSPMKLDNPSTFCLICNESLNLLTEIYFIFDLNFTRTKQENQQENCSDIFLLNFTDESKLNIWEKYDYYILAVEYCPNICVWKGKECYDILKQKKDYKIGIHGLWPSYTSGVIPKECNIGQDIEVEVDEDKEYYKNYILNHWYSLYNNNTYFLTHEYNTHGYCYNKRNNLDEYNYEYYLNKTIEVFDKHKASSLFDDLIKNIPKGENLLKKNQIIEEIEKKYPKNSFVLNCHNFNNKSYLDEIYFKLDMEFEITSNGTLSHYCGEDIWINKLDRDE